MVTFLLSIALLIAGYFTYGKIVDRIFKPDNRATPATAQQDGVDYVPMGNKKIFLIHLLNIAGLGPIVGAIQGALWGPVVYLWIVAGSILAGGVHDYIVGMLSMRNGGCSIADITGQFLGRAIKQIMRVFSVFLLLMLGTVFAIGSATSISMITSDSASYMLWFVVVIAYFFLATFLPIDKIIGKIYPVFGVCLIIMAAGVGIMLIAKGYQLPEMSLVNMHPEGLPIFPFMFITVACGAISGFHATQSPLMARCLTTEKKGRQTFYGAMIAEGVIALVWAAAGVAFYNGTGGLYAVLSNPNIGPNGAVYQICMTLLGPVGGVLAMVGVIACPITSGDTAFRSARLILADWFKLDQKSIGKRLLITVPILAFAVIVAYGFDYMVVWRYFAWSNQTLAMIALWAASVYLWQEKKPYWLTALPAVFMSAVSVTYFLAAPECLGLMEKGMLPLSCTIGIVAAIALFGLFLKNTVFGKRRNTTLPH
ncbi:carbon starvation protein A [Christensenellaceae bacterium OttesenSCG-928-K19]|nr:carbon starvation protein A [Christensenellaceae bacterium OttesenSCG-928-K19]